MSRKSKEHLKFTLFPFVSILLAVVGVLLFLTMLQAILLKSDSKEENKKKEEENTRVYERIPELNTSVLTFLESDFEFSKPDGTINKYNSNDLRELFNDIYKNLVMVNQKRANNEDSRREHLLLVVEASGAKNYFSFREKLNIFDNVSTELPIGLVLLSEGEKFKLK
jgi:hypothetical protein